MLNVLLVLQMAHSCLYFLETATFLLPSSKSTLCRNLIFQMKLRWVLNFLSVLVDILVWTAKFHIMIVKNNFFCFSFGKIAFYLKLYHSCTMRCNVLCEHAIYCEHDNCNELNWFTVRKWFWLPFLTYVKNPCDPHDPSRKNVRLLVDVVSMMKC